MMMESNGWRVMDVYTTGNLLMTSDMPSDHLAADVATVYFKA